MTTMTTIQIAAAAIVCVSAVILGVYLYKRIPTRRPIVKKFPYTEGLRITHRHATWEQMMSLIYAAMDIQDNEMIIEFEADEDGVTFTVGVMEKSAEAV